LLADSRSASALDGKMTLQRVRDFHCRVDMALLEFWRMGDAG
jgi:hypothetical protein